MNSKWKYITRSISAGCIIALASFSPTAHAQLSQVKHVIVYIQENRSTDHMYGTLAGVRGFGDRFAPLTPEGPTTYSQWTGSQFLLPYPTTILNMTDVDHGWNGGHQAANNGLWDQWVPAKGNETMVAVDHSLLTYYNALIPQYTLCDDYYCSVLSSTNPNRLYAFTGMIDPNGTGGGPATTNYEPPSGFTWTTYPEMLQNAGVSWKVYQEADNYDDNALAWFANFIKAQPGNPLYDNGMATVDDLATALKNDVTNNTLPTVSWIIAPAGESEHPSYSLQNGEVLTSTLLNALNSNPTVANSTVVFLSYDENGGFFDHIPVPLPPAGTPDEFVSGQPIGLGVRVPMLVISPWTRGGKICSQILDHTSIIQFIEKVTGVTDTNLSAWRRQVCGDMTSAFDFAHPDYTVPSIPTPSWDPSSTTTPPVLTEQTLMVQSAGAMPSCALPYQPNVICRLDTRRHQILLSMTNAGAASVHLTTFAHTASPVVPWHNDIAANGAETLAIASSTLGGAAYDIACQGPNGFYRRFAGDPRKDKGEIEASCSYASSGQQLTVKITNGSASAVSFTVASNAYHSYNSWGFTVHSGRSLTHTFPTAKGWYDIQVTAQAYPQFVRRFAGRIENGQASVTDNFGPWDALSKLAVSPSSVQGELSAIGTVALSYPAPTGGWTVLLQSGNPAVVTVPASVTVPAGATSATFPITTTAVSTATTVTLTATDLSGSKSATITVKP
jgi:phospholipase C